MLTLGLMLELALALEQALPQGGWPSRKKEWLGLVAGGRRETHHKSASPRCRFRER